MRKSGRTKVWKVSVLGFVLSGAAFAQPVRDGVVFETVDSGIADVGMLALSQRILRADLRLPTGFERVYRVRVAGGESMFARIDNGVTAVFPQSDYVATKGGIVAAVPAGTIYSIGGDLQALLPAPRLMAPLARNSAAASLFADRAVDRSMKLPAVRSRPEVRPAGVELRHERAAPLRSESGVLTIWTSDFVRQRRLDALLGS